MKRIRMELSLSYARYFLSTAELSIGLARVLAIEEAKREITRYWAIKRDLL